MKSRFPWPFLKAADAFKGKASRAVPLEGLSLKEIAAGKHHHTNGRFRNPFSEITQGSLWPVIKWKLFSRNRFKNRYDHERVVPLSIDWEPIQQHAGLAVTFLKHAGVMIKDQGQYILVDPVFFSPSQFIKDFTPLAFDIKKMPRPRHLLITHGHYDHLDVPSLSALEKQTHIITPLGYNEIFKKVAMNHRTQMDWFDTFKEGKLEIRLLPCNHWTMRNPIAGPNRSLWGSYLIRTAAGATIYISGDSGYFNGFREIGKEFSIDLAIVSVGAYEPRWFMAPSHMNPAEAVQAFQELNAKLLLIVHWGSFRLGDEPVFLPPLQVRREIARQDLLKHFLQLKPGETHFF